MEPTLNPLDASTTRSRAVFALIAASAALLLASCGIDSAQLTEKSSATTASTGSSSSTSTTRTDDPNITLPTIAQNTGSTMPPTTVAVTTTTNGPVPGGDSTPKGRTKLDIETELVKGGLSAAVARCISTAMFEQFSGDQIDQIYESNATEESGADLGPALIAIVTDCSAGG